MVRKNGAGGAENSRGHQSGATHFGSQGERYLHSKSLSLPSPYYSILKAFAS
jgi:hypothetical protein